MANWYDTDYILQVADRFGEPLFILDDWQSIVGGPFRIVDSISNLIVVAEGNSCNQYWDRIDPWRNELQVWGNGKCQWAGPIQRVTLTDDSEGQRLTLSAQDLLGWLGVRILDGDIREGDIATQLAEIIQEAMAIDNIGLAANPQFISVDGVRRITDLASALAEIRELGRDGIDFTMLGRKLLLGNEEIPFRELPALNNSHFEDVSFIKDGSTMATQTIVSGGTAPGQATHYVGRYPDTAQVDPQYGLIQRRFHETSILDEESVKVAAYTRWQQLKPVPIQINGNLRSDAPFLLGDIVAGAEVQFSGDVVAEGSASVAKANGSYRVLSVEVSILREGDEDASRLGVTLQPSGTLNGDLEGVE